MAGNVDSQTSASRPKRVDAILLLLLVASLSLNVYLGWRVKQGRTASIVQQNIAKLSPGMKVDPVTAVSLEGKQQTISYEETDKPTVLYVLSPSCIWCERNKENIDRLAKLKGSEFRFVGLSIAEDGLKDYVESHHLNFPVYTRLTPETISSLGLGGTPQTIVISPEGRILKSWPGAYREQLQREIEEYFHVQLPGLIAMNH